MLSAIWSKYDFTSTLRLHRRYSSRGGNAIDFLGELTHAELEADRRTSYAIIHAFEVMGEAAKRIPERHTGTLPDIPWTSMAGMRDKLIHDYLTIDLSIVHETVVNHLPTC